MVMNGLQKPVAILELRVSIVEVITLPATFTRAVVSLIARALAIAMAPTLSAQSYIYKTL